MTTKTHDLTNGWFANVTTADDGSKTMTIRNPDIGLRVDLGVRQMEILREAFRAEDQMIDPAANGEVALPHFTA